MENIKDENQYNEVMARIEILLREPEDNLPAMMELEILSLWSLNMKTYIILFHEGRIIS